MKRIPLMIWLFFRKVNSLVLRIQLDKRSTTMSWTSQDGKWMRYMTETKLTHQLIETLKLSGWNLSNTLYCYIKQIIAFILWLLSIAESFESSKSSNSTFKWLGRFLKDELMLDLSMKRDLGALSKLRQRRKNFSLSSTSKLQLHKGSRYLESHV